MNKQLKKIIKLFLKIIFNILAIIVMAIGWIFVSKKIKNQILPGKLVEKKYMIMELNIGRISWISLILYKKE